MPGKPMDEASRRAFLQGSAAALAIAPGMVLFAYGTNEAAAKPVADAVTSKTRWGMLIDAAKFSDADVDKCVKACQDENGWRDNGRPKTDAQWIRRVNLKNKATGEAFSLPMMCQHCAEPPLCGCLSYRRLL